MNVHPHLSDEAPGKLSDEALSDLLAQPVDTETTSTNAEVLALQSALGSYRAETLAWAQRRSATQPSLAPKAKASRWMAVPQWSLAAVAVISVAAGVVHYAGYGAEDITPAANVPPALSAAKTAPEDIAADNQLLGSIDKALRYDSVSPAVDFQAKPVRQARSSAHAEVTD